MPAPSPDSTRMLRLAAWIWIGYLLALAALDLVLYSQPWAPGPNPNPGPLLQNPPPLPRFPLMPIYIYYAANGALAAAFLAVAQWEGIQRWLGRAFYPLVLTAISAVPIILNVLVVPRFPSGPLSNAEGMALRQLPVLFLGLALAAWQYPLSGVIFYSIATTALELFLIGLITLRNQGAATLMFVALIRTISFIALGVFIRLIVARLREQQESLRQANANLTHYAATLEQLTVSRERNRMSRELHDTVVHTLSGLSVQLETMRAYWAVDAGTTRGLLDQSLETTRAGLRETRRALKALRASPLEDLGLARALQALAEAAAARGKLALQVALPETDFRVSPDVEQCLYRVAQEALENVVHHARAARLTVELTASPVEIQLLVRDDGAGFNADQAAPAGHFGLAGMRERAQLAGGALSVHSQPGQGTTIRLTMKGSQP